MVVSISIPIIVLIMVVLIRDDARQVMVMAAVNTDVLVFCVSHMGMRMTQRRQHQADAHDEAEHAQQRGHRPECKRISAQLAIACAVPSGGGWDSSSLPT